MSDAETVTEATSQELEAAILPISFQDFGLKPELQQALDEIGYTKPTPIQARTIPWLLSGQDVIGCAQTGTGKTAAFALPVLEKLPGKAQHPQALIITPTRELAEQIFQNILDYSRFLPTRSVVVYGGVPSRTQESQLKKGCDIVIATPGRLLDLLNQRALRLYDVKFLILDEADRMLDMGFIPDIENIMTYVPRKRQTLLFSATMPPAIEKLARKITVPDAEMIVEGIRSAAAETVAQKIYHVEERQKFPLLLELLQAVEVTSTIIFCRTKLGAANLAKQLINKGISAATIHSNLTQGQRQNSLDGFKRGDYKILVATDIAARGLDISQVSHVINFDTPTHPEDYVHRIGRTGRAESTGDAYTFTSPEERRYLRAIEKLIGRSVDVDPTATDQGREAVRGQGRGQGRDRGAGREQDRDRGRDAGRDRGRGREAVPERTAYRPRTEEAKRDSQAERPLPGAKAKPAKAIRQELKPAAESLPDSRLESKPEAKPERKHRHENKMKERSSERRPMPTAAEPPGQAALTEVRKARGSYVAPAKAKLEARPEIKPNPAAQRKATEFIPRQGAGAQSPVRRSEERNLSRNYTAQNDASKAPRRSAPTGGGHHAAPHASRFLMDDDIDFIDGI